MSKSKTKMQLFKKKDRTGMHQTVFLTDGTTVNGQPVKGRTVLRPGNTIFCVPTELGNPHHMDQFQLIGKDPLPAPAGEEEDAGDQAALVLQKREDSALWDIVNPKNPNKPLNEKGLRKKAATALLKEMLTEGQKVDEDDDDDEDALCPKCKEALDEDGDCTECDYEAGDEVDDDDDDDDDDED